MKKINLESKQIAKLAVISAIVFVLLLIALMIFLPASLKSSFALGFVALSIGAIFYSNDGLKKGKEHFVTIRVAANFLLLASAIALCVVSSLK